MKSQIYLLSLTLSGIKNIKDEIRIDFYKKTVDRNFNPDKYRVKAIYGENGSGKSGIITAVSILKQLITDRDFLNESSNQKLLNEIINKVTEEFHIEVEYIIGADKFATVYRYGFVLSKNIKNRYTIRREYLYIKKIKSRASTYQKVYTCENGKLIDALLGDEELISYRESTTNLLDTSTLNCVILDAITELLGESNHNTQELKFLSSILSLSVFGIMLNVDLESADQHEFYLLKESIDEMTNAEGSIDSLREILSSVSRSEGLNSRSIPKKSYEQYQKDVRQLGQFLKLFKHDIISVDIEAKEDKDIYECNLYLNYGAYRINTEFESSGIRKLIRLFDSLNASAHGQISFIDEMDANINDIYLNKIVEFFMKYGRGQLCFTTHNTSPMSILKTNKKSIDFLSNNNKIIPWTTNGNYKPETLYREGMIEYLPFNVEPEDFLGVLGD